MLRTRSGLPKHCSWNADRHATRRVRFRKGSFTTYLTGIPWSEDFMRQYATALEGVKLRQQLARWEHRAPSPGPSAHCVCPTTDRRTSARCKPSTQVMRRNIIENFRNARGDKPVKLLGRRHIKDIIGARSDKPHAANNLLKVLRVLLGYAVSIDMADSNPAIGVKKDKASGAGFIAGARRDSSVRGTASGWFTGAVGTRA